MHEMSWNQAGESVMFLTLEKCGGVEQWWELRWHISTWHERQSNKVVLGVHLHIPV